MKANLTPSILLAWVLVSSLAHGATLTGRIWEERSFHISTGDLVTTSVGPDDWEAAFNAAAGRWNGVVPFSITTDANTQLESCDPNDPNTTFFSATRCGNPWPQNVVGVSSSWAASHNGYAIQTSIVFNNTVTWDVFDGAPGADVDFTRVAVHEIGHSIGLDHTTTSSAIMFPSTSSTIVPEPDDIAGTYLIYGDAAVTGLPDINQSGDSEIAVLRPRLSDRRGIVEIREVDGTFVRKNFYRPGYGPKDLVRLLDFSGNSRPELGVLHNRVSDGRTMVEIRDSLTGTTARNVFFSPGSTALRAVVLDDINGSSFEDIAVLQVRDSDQRVIVEVRDASTTTLIRKIFYSTNYWPIDLTVVPDLNNNGADEVAVLMVRRSDLRLRVQVRDSLTGALLTTPFHPPGYTGIAIGVVGDVSGNGVPELASLSVRDSDGRVAVRLQDGQTGATVKLILYLPGSSVVAPNALAIFADNSGNGADEVGVLVQRDSDERPLLQIRDASTGSITRNVWLAPGLDGEVLVDVATINGGNSQEAAVLGFNSNLKSQARVYDSDTGAQLIIINYALP